MKSMARGFARHFGFRQWDKAIGHFIDLLNNIYMLAVRIH